MPSLFLLGTVTPGLNKFATDSLENNASVVGRLSACNTVGSILGTFLPTFVTIPAAGTFVTFPIFSGPLLALALVYFLAARADRNLWRHARSGGVVVSTRLEKSRKRGNPTWKPVMASVQGNSLSGRVECAVVSMPHEACDHANMYDGRRCSAHGSVSHGFVRHARYPAKVRFGEHEDWSHH